MKRSTIDRCLGCQKHSYTLYCDGCAPPITHYEPTSSSVVLGDRRWNGLPMTGSLLAENAFNQGESPASAERFSLYAN